MKTILVVALSVLAQAAGNTLLSKGMKAIASRPEFDQGFSAALLVQALGDPVIWLGMALMVAFLVGFMSALSWADLSFVMPATGSSYVLNVVFAHYFLGEPVSMARWAGSFIILAGVALITKSGSAPVRPGQPEFSRGEGS
jgi:drug/metabolite transporter (DMT)-like permease